MECDRPTIVCGLGFGDEGKGTTVHALARRFGPSVVVRYTGGPQAGHNVVAPDGTWHCCAQFGAGSLVDNTPTILGPKMLVDLDSLAIEARVLAGKIKADSWSLQTVDPDCLLVTPMQRLIGRMREIARGANAHGSCGMGVGETIFDDERRLSVRVRDILNGAPGQCKLREIAEVKLAEATTLLRAAPSRELADMLEHLRNYVDPEALYYNYRFKLERLTVESATDTLRRIAHQRALIFEGAQGALLDRRRGFAPYVTKSDSTCQNAIDLLRGAGIDKQSYKLGILRAYGHRHGAGPFPTEDPSMLTRFGDPYNPENRWQGAFRVGWLDLPLLRYGIHLNGGVDGLSLTGLDRLSGLERIRVCNAYVTVDGQRLHNLPTENMTAEARTALVTSCRPEWLELPGWHEDLSTMRDLKALPKSAKDFLRFLESTEALNTPIALVSVGPRADQKLYY